MPGVQFSGPLEAALVVLSVAALVLAVAVLILVIRRGFHRFSVDALGVHAEIEGVQRAIETVNRELTPNGGSSLKDAIGRMDSRLMSIDDRLTAVEEAVTNPKGSA